MLYPCVAPIVIPPPLYLANNLSISERSLIKNSFWLSLSPNRPNDSAIDVSNADVSITSGLTIFFVSFLTFSSTLFSTSFFFSVADSLGISFSTSFFASVSAFFSITSICFSIFSATSLVVD